MRRHRGGRGRYVAVAGLPGVAGALVFTGVYLAVRERLPQPLASHVGPGGRPDDFMSQGGFVATAVAVQLGMALLFAVLARHVPDRDSGPRTLAVTGAGTGPFLCVLMAQVLLAQADVSDARDMVFPGWYLATAAVPAAVGAATGWALTRHR
ncbi:hypothetical protein V1J52_16345 [Streptomyces sp. TRM 70351]|uniref:hypothetical protein n=1 Tax=Streptomyces sp. TRM 70351 TaxID=3116552 RepID=UPI002E7AED5E|nr:hypothetical protein [Streptomyces sp. TRM 70351]MEE1929737.1 hypothetical protein [Streptomyces sp. TRM 70351]